MPNVGGKRFPYTKSGVAAAEAYAKQTGKKKKSKKKAKPKGKT